MCVKWVVQNGNQSLPIYNLQDWFGWVSTVTLESEALAHGRLAPAVRSNAAQATEPWVGITAHQQGRPISEVSNVTEKLKRGRSAICPRNRRGERERERACARVRATIP